MPAPRLKFAKKKKKKKKKKKIYTIYIPSIKSQYSSHQIAENPIEID